MARSRGKSRQKHRAHVGKAYGARQGYIEARRAEVKRLEAGQVPTEEQLTNALTGTETGLHITVTLPNSEELSGVEEKFFYATRSETEHGNIPKHGTLADALLADLMKKPLIFMHRDRGRTEWQKNKFDLATRSNYVRTLNRAEKFVLEPSFVAAVRELETHKTTEIMARMSYLEFPYGTMFVEYPKTEKWLEGFLIDRLPNNDGRDVYQITECSTDPKSDHCLVYPASLLITPHPPMMRNAQDDGLVKAGIDAFGFAEYGDKIQTEPSDPEMLHRMLLTEAWFKPEDRPPREEYVAAAEIGDYGQISFTKNPAGRVFDFFFNEDYPERLTIIDDKLNTPLIEVVRSCPKDFRFLICMLLIMNERTRIVGPAMSVKTKGARLLKGKITPFYQHKTLVWEFPVKSLREYMRPTSSTGMHETPAWHTVEGHWCHSRAPNASCSTHPALCRRAFWEPLYDEDGFRAGNQQFNCRNCKRKRWRREEFSRGDKEKGIITKDYRLKHKRPQPRVEEMTPPEPTVEERLETLESQIQEKGDPGMKARLEQLKAHFEQGRR